ncbi:MAG: AAA family ATPase [Gaiellaceae bacterium]
MSDSSIRLVDRLRDVAQAENGADGRPPAAERLVPMTTRELCALPDPPKSDELLGPVLVRRQRTVIGGYTGEGKTSLALQMVAAVANRREFLGWQGIGGKVLVIDAEQGLRTIKRRLREAGLEEVDEIDYLRVPEGLALDSDPDEAQAVEALLASGEYALVLGDPLYKLSRSDPNDKREAAALMALLDGWRDRYGFALLLLMHPRKRPAQGAKLTLDELFGSGAFNWGTEVALGLERPRPGYSRLHFLKDRDGDLPVGERWGLLFDRESGFRRDPEDGKPRETTAGKVRELLEADPGITTEALLEATGRAERTVRSALREVEAESTGGGAGGPKRWYLPAEQQEMDA